MRLWPNASLVFTVMVLTAPPVFSSEDINQPRMLQGATAGATTTPSRGTHD